MPMRGDLAIKTPVVEHRVGAFGVPWADLAPLANDANLLLACVVSVIGLAASLAFAVAFPVLSDSAALLAQLGG